MVNTKHDTHSYESTSNGERGYQREIFDGNVLYESFIRAKQGSDWKPNLPVEITNSYRTRSLLSMKEGKKDELQANKYGIGFPNTPYVMKS